MSTSFSSEHGEALIERIRSSIIGRDHEIDGPFGPRLVTYADYTASGRSLTFIEDFIREHVLPYYANTHTESSETGAQSTQFREDARAIIHDAVGGGPDDVVIFTGSGATGAIHTLIAILNLSVPADLDDKYRLVDAIPAHERPVVFIGPYEHHSNELPWRESIADVVVIDEDEDGRPDHALLEAELVRYADRPLRIGSFSAASNVTGIGSGTQEISKILHRHGALAFWDFAAAAPYVQIDMDDKDAVFISPHKFIGGPSTPGVLVAKRHLLRNRVPTVPGGGTVAYVGFDHHRYIDDAAHREEGGTPDIVGAIRAGLVFQLKARVGTEMIRAREDAFIQRASARWSAHPNIRILGNLKAWRLSIISFVVRYGEKQFLHHNFVVALLNDLFGIQARGGCSCAGPYGHRLLHIGISRSKRYESEVVRGCEGIKPGWARINFNYFISEASFEYILEAVEFVAEHGWKLLPLYRFSPDAGTWEHRSWQQHPRMRLTDVKYNPRGALEFPYDHSLRTEPLRATFAGYLETARSILDQDAVESCGPPQTTADFEALRWFPLPHEI